MEKEIVRLRKRKLNDGRETLYLDIYLNGKRKYEYLKLYLLPEANRQDKQKNKETLLLAKSVQAKRLVEYQQGRFGFINHASNKVLLVDYFKTFYDEWCKKHRSAKYTYRTIFNKLKMMPDVYMQNIDKDWMVRFLHLHVYKDSVNANSQRAYLQQISCFFNYAVNNNIIEENPCKNIDYPHKDEKEREYLTIEEVRLLAANKNNRWKKTRKAFLFCCLTGFRHSDVKRITWKQVHDNSDGCKIVVKQKKTGVLIYQDISREARTLMGDRKGDDDLVFKGIAVSMYVNLNIKGLCKECGINKHISFHCSRHTFALLLLNNSTDIYTVSQLLGHTDVKTTQLYAHILDKKKQEAVNSLPSIFN